MYLQDAAHLRRPKVLLMPYLAVPSRPTCTVDTACTVLRLARHTCMSVAKSLTEPWHEGMAEGWPVEDLIKEQLLSCAEACAGP